MSPGSHKQNLTQKEHGFTLIELIIVIVIIGILTVIAVSRYRYTAEKAGRARVLSTLVALRGTLLSYYTVKGYPTDGSCPSFLNTGGNKIEVELDGITVQSITVPSGYLGWSSGSDCLIYNNRGDEFGCSYGIYVNSGAIVLTTWSESHCTLK